MRIWRGILIFLKIQNFVNKENTVKKLKCDQKFKIWSEIQQLFKSLKFREISKFGQKFKI